VGSDDGFVRLGDGRELYVERRGTGAPTVVFEAGMGASRSSWGAVVWAVAERTATVAYDRSGLGRSPRDPAPRGLTRLVDDLVELLDHLAADGAGPFVLVGHSWGGPIVRKAAGRVPDRVAGLVLVDQTDEGCDLFFTPANRRRARVGAWAMPAAARLGLMRMVVGRLARSLPEPAATALRAEDGTVAAMRAHVAEMTSSLDDLQALRDRPPVLPDVPVTLVSGTRASRLEGKQRPALVAAHRARAEALPQGRHVATDRAAHMVPFDDPAIVADEVLRVLDVLAARPT
jgi:pimeloyl-ACP methyl ester carboxylesterase